MTLPEETLAVTGALVSGGICTWMCQQVVDWHRMRQLKKASAKKDAAEVQVAEIQAKVDLRKLADEAAAKAIEALGKSLKILEDDFHRRDALREEQIRESNELHVTTIAGLNERLSEAESKIKELLVTNGTLVAQTVKDAEQKKRDDATIRDLRNLVKRLQADKDRIVAEKASGDDECQKRITALSERIDELEKAQGAGTPA